MKSFKTNLIIVFAFEIISTVGIASEALATPDEQIKKLLSAPAAELTTTRCLICHGDTQVGQKRLAPPFMMVKRHYQSLDKDEFIQAISSWVKEPSKNRTKMPGAINRFGLMPAFGYPEVEVQAIAEYIYETDFQMPGRGNCNTTIQGKGRGSAKTAKTKGSNSKDCTPNESPAAKTEGTGDQDGE